MSEFVKVMDMIYGWFLDCLLEFLWLEICFYFLFFVGVFDDVIVEKLVKLDGLILVEDFLNYVEEEELI